MQLKYKTVMMTGGASGIGRATVLMLAKEGARVLLCDVNEAGANETIKMAGGAPIEFVKLELTDGASIDACAKEALKRAGDKIDVFVNAAGWDRTQPFVEADQAFLDKVLGINLVGPRAADARAVPGDDGGRRRQDRVRGERRRPRRQPRRDALLGGQGRHHRLYEIAGARGRAPQDHRQLRLPRPHRHAAVPRQPRAHARGSPRRRSRSGDSPPPTTSPARSCISRGRRATTSRARSSPSAAA